jgi:hypothetical protein
MYALIITILVYSTGGQILSASTTSVAGYESKASCEEVAGTLDFTEANSKRLASCIPVY